MENENYAEKEIEVLKLSNRTYSSLKRNGIHTVNDILLCTEDKIKHIKNIGDKAVDEIVEIKSKLIKCSLNLEDETICRWIFGSDFKEDLFSIKSIDGVIEEDIQICNMNLSIRAQRCLYSINVKTLRNVLKLNKRDFMKIRNLGKKSIDEIMEAIKKYVIVNTYIKTNHYQYDEFVDFIQSEYREIGIELSKFIVNISIDEIINNGHVFNNRKEEFYQNDFIQRLYGSTRIRDFIKSEIVKIIGDYEIHYNEIKLRLPKHFNNNMAFFEIMNELEEECILEVKDGNYKKRLPRVVEFIENIEAERIRKILMMRLQGETLESIALKNSITRERVRQIEVKFFKFRPRLREDDYVILFENYEWEEESFRKIFKEDLITYNYLNLLYKKGKKKIELMLFDDTISLKIRQNVEKYCNRNYIFLEGEKIKKNSTDLLKYVLKSQCKEDTTIDNLKEKYKKLLIDENLDESLFGLEDKYFENKVTLMSNVLWKMGKKLRYYDIFEMDIKKFIKQIDLNSFKDIEISTKLILDEYPEVMIEYDIRDEYELHNLFKKRENELEEYKISFGKMPMISFGNASRDMQVLNMLIEEAPVSNHNLAIRYQQEFGVKSTTVLANFFKCIDEYFVNGIYDIEVEEIPSNEFELLKSVLKNDIYLVYEVKKIYKEYFPEANLSRLSSYVYKKLGFKMSVNILYSNNYASAEKCFREYLTKSEIINLSDSQSKFTINQTFYNVLQTLKNDLTLIEFEPNQYIKIDKMIEKDISKEMLLKYGTLVEEFIGNRLFTIQSLRKNGFVHKLDELGFGEIFYESLLKANSRFDKKRISNLYLFGLKGLNISISNLIKTIINRYQSYDIYDLLEYLNDEYGIKIDKHKIVSFATESGLFYSSTMEKVYIDYEEFYKEI